MNKLQKWLLRFFTYVNNPLEWIRGVACLMVIWWHISYHYFYSDTYRAFGDAGWIFSSSAYVGVWIFYILSGYLIGKNFFSGRYTISVTGVIRFYISRLIKIVPLYFLIILYINFFYNSSGQVSTYKVVQYFIFNSNSLIRVPYFGYLWFISILIQIYFLSPVFYILFMAFHRIKLPVSLQGASILIYTVLVPVILFTSEQFNTIDSYHIGIYSSLWVNVGFFLVGFFLNVLLSIRPSILHTNLSSGKKYLRMCFTTASYASIVLLYCLGSYITYRFVADFSGYEPYMIIVLPFLTIITVSIFVYLAEYDRYPHRPSKSYGTTISILGIFQLIGKHSYVIYLIHYPIIFLLTDRCLLTRCIPVYYLMKAILIVSLSLLISVLWYIIIQKFPHIYHRIVSLDYKHILQTHMLHGNGRK